MCCDGFAMCLYLLSVVGCTCGFCPAKLLVPCPPKVARQYMPASHHASAADVVADEDADNAFAKDYEKEYAIGTRR